MQKKNNRPHGSVKGCSQEKHIVHIITGLQRGGAETVLITLATELAQAPYHYKQSVIYFKDGPLRSDLESLGIDCYKASYISTFSRIQKLKPDLIHSSLWSANFVARLYAKLLSIPVYCSLHNLSEHSGVFRNFIDALFPFTPTGFIAVSQEVKRSYTQFLPPKKITIIENGIPAAPWIRLCSPQAAAITPPPSPETVEGLTRNPGTYTIGAIGRFVPVKNYDLLLDAFALLHKDFPQTRLLLVGHGPLENSLRAQVIKLAISEAVTFIINKPAQEFYPLFDCFVQPSKHEGISIALLEALQAQLPVIVTGKNKQHNVVEDDKHGLVIEPDSIQELYLALRKYILNPELAYNHAQEGQSFINEKFSSASMAKKYHTLFVKNYLHSSQ